MIKGVLTVCPMLGPSWGYSEEPYRGTSSTQRDSSQAQRVHAGGAGRFPHALDPVSLVFLSLLPLCFCSTILLWCFWRACIKVLLDLEHSWGVVQCGWAPEGERGCWQWGRKELMFNNPYVKLHFSGWLLWWSPHCRHPIRFMTAEALARRTANHTTPVRSQWETVLFCTLILHNC